MKLLDRGRVAQLGEHLLCKQGVAGSIPATSTSFSFPVTELVVLGGVDSIRSFLVAIAISNKGKRCILIGVSGEKDRAGQGGPW